MFNNAMQCKYLKTSIGNIWKINGPINCNRKSVTYYPKCLTCDQTYTGQTNSLRLRMYGHKSGSRLRNNNNIFVK